MKLIDLSTELAHGDNYHFDAAITDHVTHSETKPRFEPPAEGYAVKKLLMSDHTATHVDAPRHFIPDGPTIEATNLDKYYGPGKVLDFSDYNSKGGQLTLSVFMEKLQQEDIAISAGDCLLFKFKGSDGPVFNGLAEDLSQHLVDSKIKLIGTDQPSIDYMENKSRPAHRVLLGAGIPIVEFLTNMETVKGKPFTFIGLPIKLKGATGSPIRAVAMVD